MKLVNLFEHLIPDTKIMHIVPIFSTSRLELCLLYISEFKGMRIDKALAQALPAFSRERIQEWIEKGYVLVNDIPCARNRYTVLGHEKIEIHANFAHKTSALAQNVFFQIAYEDDHVLVINKPAGLITHPGAGHPDHTLVNGLIAHYSQLAELPRAGIIHRLDKDTTGLLLVAKTTQAYTYLIRTMQDRHIQRHYLALVYGHLISGGTIRTMMQRHQHNRTKMAVSASGKQAITHFVVRERFAHFTLLDVKLETGRTHQIRVHFAHLRHPLVGDKTYGQGMQIPHSLPALVQSHLRSFQRQALHAYRLCFTHPVFEKECDIEIPLSDDLTQLLNVLRQQNGKTS